MTLFSKLVFAVCFCTQLTAMPLFWWEPAAHCSNFGDALSPLIVEKMAEELPRKSRNGEKKLLAVGSILHFASNYDVVWGSGLNGKVPASMHQFSALDIRAVRGPLTRDYLLSRGIECPEVYGDPALLLPRLFPQLTPSFEKEFIVIPNLNEISAYKNYPNVVLPTLPVREVIEKILEAKFVIAGSLHGIIVAEAFGIPARMLRVTDKEALFKYQDYYAGTGRSDFSYATSLKEALEMGGEAPHNCNLDLLENSFPFDLR